MNVMAKRGQFNIQDGEEAPPKEAIEEFDYSEGLPAKSFKRN